MKPNRIFALLLALSLFLPVLAACGRDEKTPPAPIEKDGEAATMRQAEIPFDEVRELYHKYKDTSFLAPRGVQNAAGLAEALSSGRETAVRLYGDAADSVKLEEGSYEGVDFIFDAPNIGFESTVPLGSLVINRVSSPVTLSGQVKNVFVYGADVTLEASGAMRLLCVSGQNCRVSLSGAAVPVIWCLSASAEIENDTKTAIDVYLANGTVRTVAAGQTFGMQE